MRRILTTWLLLFLAAWSVSAATIRTEANFLNRKIVSSATGPYGETVKLVSTAFSPAATCYFEVVGYYTSSAVAISLHDESSTIATINLTSSLSRLRSSSFSLTSGDHNYRVLQDTAAEANVYAARIVVIQTGAPIVSTETQHEVGSYDAGLISATEVPIPNLKYWYYDSANWNGTLAFYADVTFTGSNSMGSTSFWLQEDDGSFGTWTNKIQIVSADPTIVPKLVRSASFTPTSGRNYRIAYLVGNDMYASTIFNAKVVVQQTSTPTKLESSYQLGSFPWITGRADQWNRWEPSEWVSTNNTYYNEHSADGTSRTTGIYEDSGGSFALIIGSGATGANRARSSSITMPAAANIDGSTSATAGLYGNKLLTTVVIQTVSDVEVTVNPYLIGKLHRWFLPLPKEAGW